MKTKLIQVNDTIRIESGPARRVAIATKKLIAELGGRYQIGDKDSKGEVITLGQPMCYLDRSTVTWYVYRLVPVGINAKREVLFPAGYKYLIRGPEIADQIPVAHEERYLPVAECESLDEALAETARLEAQG